MARQWILTGQEGFERSLEYQTNVPVPAPSELGPDDVLVTLHAASLNYRELTIPQAGGINGPMKPGVVPGCDGAGIVEAVGSAVTAFRPGDRVVTSEVGSMDDDKIGSKGRDDRLDLDDVFATCGQGIDGTLRTRGVFGQAFLHHAPKTLDFITAAMLPCAWKSAWNILFGQGKDAVPGSWVLVQGTGGVSIAVLQIAVAAGCHVVATTSTAEKAAKLKALGAEHVLNYRETADWGAVARALTPGARGFDIIPNIGGEVTMRQSLAAIRKGGLIALVGASGNEGDAVSMFEILLGLCFVRGVLSGTRGQMKALCQFIDEKGVRPAVDDVEFELAEAKGAYRRMQEGKHFSKVVIRIDHP